MNIVAAPGTDLEALRQELDRCAGFPLVPVRLADAGQQALGPHDVREHEGVLAGWFARHGCRVALVRPDHYVFGGAASVAGGVALLQALREMLGIGAVAATLAA